MLENMFNYPNSNELSMYYCGKRIKTPNHSYGPEVRTHFLIVLIKDGYGTFLSFDEPRRLTPGSILVMFPDERIHYVVDKDSTWTISWIGVYGNQINGFLEQVGITPQNPIHKVNNINIFSDIIEEIYKLSFSSEINDKLSVISLLYKFFAALIKEDPPKENIDYVNEAIHIIDYNYNQDLTVTKIADILHINPVYLSRIFKEKKGISPKEYILSKKIERAKQMLLMKNLKINEIASSLGFLDALYFSRLFRHKTGISPSEFAKINKH